MNNEIQIKLYTTEENDWMFTKYLQNVFRQWIYANLCLKHEKFHNEFAM